MADIPLNVLINNSLYQKIIYVYCHLKTAIMDFNLTGEMYVCLSAIMPSYLCRNFAAGGPIIQRVPPPVYN